LEQDMLRGSRNTLHFLLRWMVAEKESVCALFIICARISDILVF